MWTENDVNFIYMYQNFFNCYMYRPKGQNEKVLFKTVYISKDLGYVSYLFSVDSFFF